MDVLAALSLGFFGSLHCIGMCGPLALALLPTGISQPRIARIATSSLFYNFEGKSEGGKERGRERATRAAPPSLLPSLAALLHRTLRHLPFDFICERIGVIQFAHRFHNACGVNGDGAIRGFVIDEIADQTFDVAIKRDADKLTIAIDERRTGVAARYVIRRDEVQRRSQIQFADAIQKSLRRIEW